MPRLTSARFRGIAAKVSEVQSSRLRDRRRRAGQALVTSGTGPDGASEAYAIQKLVTAGAVSQEEADAYMAQAFPDRAWAGRQYGDQADAGQDAEINQAVLERKPGASAAIFQAQQLPGRKRNRGVDPSAAGGQPIRAPKLSSEFDPVEVQRAIESVGEQAAQAIRQVRATPPDLPAHSIDGASIRPGSIPFEALEGGSVARALAWPTQDEAIEIRLTHSDARDRYVRRVSVAGPGRVWTASDSSSRNSRLGVGPARYRIVTPGMRFGVMSTRLEPTADLAANLNPGFRVQYGIVIAGIPHFRGQAPSRILAVEAVGDTGTSFRTLFQTGGNAAVWPPAGTSRNFYWNRTQADHLDLGSYPFADAFGSDTSLAASAASLRDTQGFMFQLVTGRDGGEVFRQLCSRQTLGRALRMDGHGPAASLPAGIFPEAPTVPICVDWGSPTSYTHRTESYDLTTVGTRVVTGMPFSYDDCAALAATGDTFSLVVMPVGEKLVSQSPAPTYGTPEVWWQNGLKVAGSVTGRLRSWALDIIVD